MKVSGFTFVKNAVKYGYPVAEAIKSILPVVDEMIVCLGDSEDETSKLIEAIGSDKIKVIHSVWDKDIREGGRVLAEETNKALDATAAAADWLFYIQADEIVHEKYHAAITDAMKKYEGNKKVDGLLFNYRHFFGSYKYVGDGRAWYSKEIRIIRNDKRIRSYKDAQGFRFGDGNKLHVKLIDAYIYHYGWVRDPFVMYQKQQHFDSLYSTAHNNKKLEPVKFDYSKVDSVMRFEGTHPAVMKELIDKEDWHFEKDISTKNFKNFKHKLLYFLSKNFGWRPFEYSNYKRI